MTPLPIQRSVNTRPVDFNSLSIALRIRAAASACCANPCPQLMYDSTAKRVVLQCMNCSAIVG